MSTLIHSIVQSLNGSSDDILFDVPLFVIYLKMLLLLLRTCNDIATNHYYTSLVVDPCHNKNEQLHIYLFVANLLITDVTTTIRFTFEIFSMVLYLLNVDMMTIKHLDIIYSIITIRAAQRN